MALVPTVHREDDRIRTVLDIADDDAAFLPGLPPDGREAQRPPAALTRRGPQEVAATEPVERPMNAPERVLEPRRRDFRWSGCLGAMADTSRDWLLPHHTLCPHSTDRSPVVVSLLEQQKLPTGTPGSMNERIAWVRLSKVAELWIARMHSSRLHQSMVGRRTTAPAAPLS